MSQNPSNVKLIAGMIGVAVLIFAALTWVILKMPADQASGANQAENVTFNDQNDPSVGPASAKVTVHEYSDFQCPYCSQADPVFRQVIAQYQDRVRFVWKDFPLPMHANSNVSANAARCAQVQGRYQAYHDKLFDVQNDWADQQDPKSLFLQYAKTLGLDVSAFQSCLGRQSQQSLIQADVDEGQQNNVDATPTFFVNSIRESALSLQGWQKVLDQALKDAVTASSTTK